MCHRLGDFIRERRTARGLTQAKLGVRAGVSTTVVGQIEAGNRLGSGRASPDSAALPKICVALGLSLAEAQRAVSDDLTIKPEIKAKLLGHLKSVMKA